MSLSPDGNQSLGGLDQQCVCIPIAAKEFQNSGAEGHLGVTVRCDSRRMEKSWHPSVTRSGHFLEPDSREKEPRMAAPGRKVCSVAFTTDTAYLAAGTSEGVVDLYRDFMPKKRTAGGLTILEIAA